MKCTPLPRRARSTACFVAVYTASTSLPSTVTVGMPYPLAFSARFVTANCFSGGVEYAQWLYSPITTSGQRCTAAKLSPSWNVPVEVPPAFQGVGRRHGLALLPQGSEQAADHLGLPVESGQPLLQGAGEAEVVVDLQQLGALQRRRYGGVAGLGGGHDPGGHG